MTTMNLVTALVTFIGTLGAVGFTSFLRARASKKDVQSEAYESFITSAEILSLRAIVSSEERALRRLVIIPTFANVGPYVLSLLAAALFPRVIKDWNSVGMVRDALRTPSEVSQTVSDELLLQGI